MHTNLMRVFFRIQIKDLFENRMMFDNGTFAIFTIYWNKNDCA